MMLLEGNIMSREIPGHVALGLLVGCLMAFWVGDASAESGIEKVNVSRPWRIAFVSKDQRLANEGATSPYWARAWEGAHRAFDPPPAAALSLRRPQSMPS